MIYNIVIDEDKFEDIKVIEEKDIEYIKNELERIKIINDYTKEMLIDNNKDINKVEEKIIIENNILEVAYKNEKKNIMNSIYLSMLGLVMSIYIIIKR